MKNIDNAAWVSRYAYTKMSCHDWSSRVDRNVRKMSENMDDSEWVIRYSYVRMSHHGKERKEKPKQQDKPNTAWTDYAFTEHEKKMRVSNIKKIEVVGKGGENRGVYNILFDGKKYSIPANRVYKRPDRFSPSHIPEAFELKEPPK